MSRKAQSGAAILIGLIAIMIILYVLFLPPQDRAQLLGESQGGSGPGGLGSNVLFSATVGTVHPASTQPQTHTIQSLSIQALEQGSVLVNRDTITAKNNVFEKAPGVITFTADPLVTKNAVLSMNVRSKSGGNLIVNLNGVELFNQEVSSRTVPPIPLPDLQHDNTLTISTSSVGFAFWKSNTYTLNNIRVTADVTDLSQAAGTQRFTLSPAEYSNLESAVLTFIPICRDEGRIRISINDYEILSGVPDCGTINTFELVPSRLVEGENTISATTSEADVLLDRMSISTAGKQQENRVFTFDVDTAAVQGRQVGVRVAFSDASTHAGILYVNGNAIPFSATDNTVIPITSYMQSGANTLSFAASNNEFEVVSVDVLRS